MGILLCTMLVGQLPWAEATPHCAHYTAYTNSFREHRRPPDAGMWTRLGPLVQSELVTLIIRVDLLMGMLNPTAARRVRAGDILKHTWMYLTEEEDLTSKGGGRASKRAMPW